MTRVKKPTSGIIIALLALGLLSGIVWKIPPANIVWEIITLGLFIFSVAILSSWIWGRKKYAVFLTLFLTMVLVLNRFELLNWISLGLLLACFGLINLIY